LPADSRDDIFVDSHLQLRIGPARQSAARFTMKDGVHPEYFETQVSCGCGNKFTTRSTRKELKVDICSVCHPFYTGKLKFVDTAGRIEKFKSKFAAGYASVTRGKKKQEAAAEAT
jgi:large subunit ribosomal protein L31